MVILNATSFLEGHKSDPRETFRITLKLQIRSHIIFFSNVKKKSF